MIGFFTELQIQESYRRFVYDDATGQEIVPGYTVKGNPTIGYGRNLIAQGISEEEALVLLQRDIERAWREVREQLPWAESQLSVIRFAALVNMAFNLGVEGLRVGGIRSRRVPGCPSTHSHGLEQLEALHPDLLRP